LSDITKGLKGIAFPSCLHTLYYKTTESIGHVFHNQLLSTTLATFFVRFRHEFQHQSCRRILRKWI